MLSGYTRLNVWPGFLMPVAEELKLPSQAAGSQLYPLKMIRSTFLITHRKDLRIYLDGDSFVERMTYKFLSIC